MGKLLTAREVAEMLRCHRHHIYRLVSEKRIRHFKIPGVGVRFDSQDIEKMIAEAEIREEDWGTRIKEWR